MVFCCIIIPIPRRRAVQRRKVYIRQRQPDGSIILVPKVVQPAYTPGPGFSKSLCLKITFICILLVSFIVTAATYHNIIDFTNVNKETCLLINEYNDGDGFLYTFEIQTDADTYINTCSDNQFNIDESSTVPQYHSNQEYYCWINSNSHSCHGVISDNNPHQNGLYAFCFFAFLSIICIGISIYLIIRYCKNRKASLRCVANEGNVQKPGGRKKKKLTSMQQARNSMKRYFVGHSEWIHAVNMISEECEGFGNIFINGTYNGWYMMTMRYSSKHKFVFDLHFDNESQQVNGSGVDDVGEYILGGIYNSDTLRIALKKQYIDKHAVEIRLEYDSKKKEFVGAWHIGYSKINGVIDYNATKTNGISWGAYGCSLKEKNRVKQGTYIQLEGTDNMV